MTPLTSGVPSLGDETLVFMHVPKTGGTALRSSIIQAFEPHARALVYPAADLAGSMTRAEFEALPDDRRNRLRLVMGHFQFGIHEQIARPCRYATIVRDPVERVVSLYYHYRNLPGIRFGGRGHRERLRLRLTRTSFEEWVFREERRTADNVTVRSITGRGDIPFGQCTDGLFEQAMERVDQHFLALLVTEAMAESANVLGMAIRRDLPLVRVENTNPKRPPLEDLDPSTVDRVRELNRFDFQLHEIARERLGQMSAESSRPEAQS